MKLFILNFAKNPSIFGIMKIFKAINLENL